MKPESDPPWVGELAAELAQWDSESGCVICDRRPVLEVDVAGRRWTLCGNPGCRALVEPVRTLGDLVEVRKAGS